ncbi:MAG: hypothetical protein R2820_11180 [Cyclobacteriaceae bacterium]|nr:hypothetical protein [Cyclobacteriaceae bacterium]
MIPFNDSKNINRLIVSIAALFVFSVCVMTLAHRVRPILNSEVDEQLRSNEIEDLANFDYNAQFELSNYLVLRDSGLNDIDTVDFDCAILVYPTLDQIEGMKEEEGEKDFYIGADDSNWYQAQSIEMIDSVGVTKIGANRYLHLVGFDKTWNLDVRKEGLPAWNLIFFKTTKEPEVISTIDLTVAQVRDYFER